MRLVEQFATVLAKIIGLKEQKKYKAALEIVDNSLNESLGFALDWPDSESLETFEQQVREGLKTSDEKWKVVSDLLYEKSELLLLQGFESDAREIAEKLVVLLFHLIHHKPQASSLDCLTRMENILYFLRQQRLSSSIYQKILDHYCQRNQFAIAEDWLFEAVELSNNAKDIHEIGLRFYQGLLKLDDSVLEKGRLPRNEILNGLEELQNTEESS